MVKVREPIIDCHAGAFGVKNKNNFGWLVRAENVFLNPN
jgi:hypothetical protein